MIRALALAMLLLACGSPAPSSDPISRTSRVAGFEMTFTLPRTVWKSNERIVGEATLTKVDGPEATISYVGSNLLQFRFAAEGHDLNPVTTLACGTQSMTPGTSLRSMLRGHGHSLDADDPDYPIYASWTASDGVVLPAGEWQIQVFASFTEDSECRGTPHSLSIPVTITVVD